MDDPSQTEKVTVMSLAEGLGIDFLPMATLLFLDGPDIARAGLANRFLYRAANDEGVWKAARDRLWEGKVFVRESTRALNAKEAYITSLMDSRRTWLEKDELTSFSWWFRFKQQAGEAWTARDPWYRNEKVRSKIKCKLSRTFHGHRSQCDKLGYPFLGSRPMCRSWRLEL